MEPVAREKRREVERESRSHFRDEELQQREREREEEERRGRYNDALSHLRDAYRQMEVEFAVMSDGDLSDSLELSQADDTTWEAMSNEE